MNNIVNPITHKGKVKCLHYYELCTTTWYDKIMCIFKYDGHIYFYSICDESKHFDHNDIILEDFGEDDPLNMDLALIRFTNKIYNWNYE